MAKAVTPRKPGRLKGPGKKKSENDPAGQEAAGMEGGDTASAGEAPGGNGNTRTGRELGLEVPTTPVEVPAETQEEEEAAAATVAKGQTGLTVNIAKLQAKLADAKARERTIVARTKSAAGRVKIRSKLYDERITDAFARFEQVERALDEMEGRVESFDLGRKATLADELAGIEKDARVEEELAELKARLGNGPRPMPVR